VTQLDKVPQCGKLSQRRLYPFSLLSEQLIYFLNQGLFRGSADDLVNQVTLVEKEQSGNAANLETGRRLLMAAAIQLSDNRLAAEFFCQGVDGWRQHATGTAGRREKINHYRKRRLFDKIRKYGIVQFHRDSVILHIYRSLALAAFWFQMLFVSRDSVLDSALGTLSDCGIHAGISSIFFLCRIGY
jgi:hypothetical protein